MRQNFNPGVASRMIDQIRSGSKVNVTDKVGENVSKVYPWISGFKQTISGVALAETRLTRPGDGGPAFFNNTDRNIKIEQIRFFAEIPIGGTFAPTSVLLIENRLLCKIVHSDFSLVPEWLPIGMLQTGNSSKMYVSARTGFCMTLPTKYYLQAGHSFRMRVRSTNPFHAAANYTFEMCLYGEDPKTKKPYNLIKSVTIPYRATPVVSDANPQYVDVVFDDNRDYPMRDLLLTHIGIAAYPYAAAAQYDYQYISLLDFQIVPPEGPKWMDFTDWAPFSNLVDQVNNTGIISFVRYVLPSPINFTPRQQIDIDVKPLFGMNYLSGQREVYEIPLWVALIGTQEQKVGE